MRLLAMLLLLVAFPLAGCTGPSETFECDDAVSFRPTTSHVRLETTHGNSTLELHGDKAPITVCNFLGYVEAGFYDDTLVHRVVAGFVAQGGGCTLEGTLKPTPFDPIKNEARDSGLQNLERTLSMARTQEPDSATSQFFVNLDDNTRTLDPTSSSAGYAVFATVIDGWQTWETIGQEPTHVASQPDPCHASQEKSTPDEPIVLRSARVTAVPTG
jgi:cyclophilin family peptidyl-prolyl cis-trans isomerase